MKFPYGISDFQRIILNDYFYVDRTDRLKLIEEAGSQLLFLRPRRFGKSLLLSMLEYYYDVAHSSLFPQLFGHLAIGQNPTPMHNRYFVLKWDFSMVKPQGPIAQIGQALYDHLNDRIKAFATRYQDYLHHPIEIKEENAISSFESLLTAVQQTPYPLYLLIDEYDNFANELMMGRREASPERYKDLLYGEGILKVVFKAVKAASAGRGLERVFLTGISPVVMSDLTSGYNVAENIYLRPEFNDLCGFSEAELVVPLRQIVKECDMPLETVTTALMMMRTFYNGYCFNIRTTQLIYNPTLALYFLKNFQLAGQYPDEMLDDNLAMDRGKLTYISQLPQGEQLLLTAVAEQPPVTIPKLASRFGVEDMLYATKDTTFMASLLYFFGVLTYGGRADLGKLMLKIPNLVVRRLYIERLQEVLLPNVTKEEIGQLAEDFYRSGDLQPLCDFIEQRYFKVFDNRDYRWANELTIKTMFVTLLFNDTFYMMDSETALHRGYADLTMILRPDTRQYPLLDFLIEFKYVKDIAGAEAKSLSLEELKAKTAIQQKLADAETKLTGYQQVLQNTYGDVLRLHTYSVVAVGFERLVWQRLESKS